jgi:hypothetical protein
MARKEGSSAAIATETASNTAKPAARLKVARLIGGVPEFFKRPSANNTETANVALTLSKVRGEDDRDAIFHRNVLHYGLITLLKRFPCPLLRVVGGRILDLLVLQAFDLRRLAGNPNVGAARAGADTAAIGPTQTCAIKLAVVIDVHLDLLSRRLGLVGCLRHFCRGDEKDRGWCEAAGDNRAALGSGYGQSRNHRECRYQGRNGRLHVHL